MATKILKVCYSPNSFFTADIDLYEHKQYTIVLVGEGGQYSGLASDKIFDA